MTAIRTALNPSGTCCWGWRFGQNLLTGNVMLLMARAAEEAQVVSLVYV